ICRHHPLGLRPEDLGWSISAVRTPLGWIGRLDIYGEKANTYHMQVVPNYALRVEERFKEISRSKIDCRIASPALKNIFFDQYIDYETLGDDFDDIRDTEYSLDDHYYEDYDIDEHTIDHDNYDTDDNDDSFEQFIFMGGLNPNNW